MSFKKLRKVRPHEDVIEPDDHNNLVDNLKIAYNILQDRLPKIDPTIIDKLDELKSLINKMRYVQYGDYVFADDHNMLVDAFNKVADICETLKRLAFVPKETYSIVARAKARVLAWGVEKLPYSESYSLTTGVIHPSGADPNNPAWMPTGGWSKVWDFNSQDEVTDFGNYEIYGNWVAENSILHCTTTSPDHRYDIIRIVEGVRASKMAVAFKVHIEKNDSLGPDKILQLVIIKDETSKVLDAQMESYNETQFKCLGQWWNEDTWYVLELDFDNGKGRIYDPNGNLLHETDVGWSGVPNTPDQYKVYIYDWRYVYTTPIRENYCYVDWVAIKYE